MKYLRSLSALLTVLVLFSYGLSANAQTNCDSLDYMIELIDPFQYSTIEYGDLVQMEVLTSFPPSQISKIEWFSEFELECDDCLSNSFTPTDTTTVSVNITLDDGCMISDEHTFNVFLRKDFYTPNAFSPNSDGVNDVFLIYAYKTVEQIKSFLIFSRKGHLVYEAHNYPPNSVNFGWNGRLRGKNLHSETYVWKAVLEYINGEEETLTGTVDLVR